MKQDEKCQSNLQKKALNQVGSPEEQTPEELIAEVRASFEKDTEGYEFDSEIPNWAGGIDKETFWRMHLLDLKLRYTQFGGGINSKIDALNLVDAEKFTNKQLVYMYINLTQEFQSEERRLNEAKNIIKQLMSKTLGGLSSLSDLMGRPPKED